MSSAEGSGEPFDVAAVWARMWGVLWRQWWRITVIVVVLIGLPHLGLAVLRLSHEGGYRPGWPLGLALFLLAVLAQAAITWISLEDSQGRRTTLRETFAECLLALPSLLIVTLIQILGISIGFMLLVVPGFYAMAALAPATCLVLLRESGPVGSLRAGQFLVEGRVGRVLAALAVVHVVVLGPGYLALKIADFLNDPGPNRHAISEAIGQVLWFLAQGLAIPAIFHQLWWGQVEAHPAVAKIFD